MKKHPLLTEMLRNWANTEYGKKVQCEIFRYVYEHEEEFKDYDRFAWFDTKGLAKCMKDDGISFNDIYDNPYSENGKAELTHERCVLFAVYRLFEHEYLTCVQFSRGDAYRMTNKGKQAFEKCEAKKECLKYIEGQTAEELIFNWTVSDLNDFAKKLRIKNRSKMTKPQLAMAIEDVIHA